MRIKGMEIKGTAAWIMAAFLVAHPLAVQAGTPVPRRIISVSPASTEILYYLGLGDRVAGVTSYCSWPPEAKSKPSLGDMMFANIEVIASMRPDLVLLSNMNEHLKAKVESLGFPALIVYQDNFEQICDSMLRVGAVCGIEDEAADKVDGLKASVREIAERARQRGGEPPKVLIVVGRDMDDTMFKRVYVGGPGSFYQTLIGEAGAVNIITGKVPYENISKEGLIRLDPDIIIELIGESGMANASTESIMAQWRTLDSIRAVREGNVAIIRGDFGLRAGPRYPLLLSALVSIVYEGVREVKE